MVLALNSVHGPANVMTDTSGAATKRLIEHVVTTRIDDLPPAALQACKTFVLDSLGVALSGSRVPQLSALRAMTHTWGHGNAARVWGSGERLPVASAAFLNGYQIHNQEWDCVHEPAVVHPMAVVLATLLAHCEANRRIDGRRFLLACIVAVDVAATIGCAARNRLRFFRPAMCGALGATAGLGVLTSMSAATLRSAMGLCYSQVSGTMQAHVEGSPVLPMQIGFNTRAALNAIELASRGVQGPIDFLEGAFGYFALMDPESDLGVFSELGHIWRVTELSHKPFPSGRATHGGVDGALTLKAQHGFANEDIAALRVYAPPLVIQLVDRPAHANMDAAYARLCLPYVVATALLHGDVGVADFEPSALRDSTRLQLAERITLQRDANPSLNALAPQRVTVTLQDGRALTIELPAVLGAPARPLNQLQHLAKFRRAANSGSMPLVANRVEALIATVAQLEDLPDMCQLIDLLEFDAT